MSDILIVHPFENMIINVFGMHFDFIILHVSTIMEVPLLRLQIEPCHKCLQGEAVTSEPEKEEPLNQPIQIDSDIMIIAKTSISQSLAHKEEPKTEKTFKELVPKEYHQFWSVFEKKASECFPESRSWDCRIDLKSEFIPKRLKLYPLGQREEEEMNKFIDDNLKKGFIRPSNSPQASPFFFIAKKDSKTLRLCQDYRYLNKYTIKNAYPLPSINDLLNKLLGATILRS